MTVGLSKAFLHLNRQALLIEALQRFLYNVQDSFYEIQLCNLHSMLKIMNIYHKDNVLVFLGTLLQ